MDEYYNYNPYHSRSSKFVQDKGLITNEKSAGSSSLQSPAVTPGLLMNDHKRLGPSNLHDSIASTLTPSMHSSVSPSLPPTRAIPDTDLRRLSLLQHNSARDSPSREQGNTKKKRMSLSGTDGNVQVHHTQISSPTEETEPRSQAFGDPDKIMQFFPELR